MVEVWFDFLYVVCFFLTKEGVKTRSNCIIRNTKLIWHRFIKSRSNRPFRKN